MRFWRAPRPDRSSCSGSSRGKTTLIDKYTELARTAVTVVIAWDCLDQESGPDPEASIEALRAVLVEQFPRLVKRECGAGAADQTTER